MKTIRNGLGLFIFVLVIASLACNLPGRNPTNTSDIPTATEENPTDTPTGPTDTPEDPTATTDPDAECTSDSKFVDDVTIPDGTLVEPGNTVTKTWRIRNDGTCIWDSGYFWEQLNFDTAKFKASARTIPLTTDVAPGETFDISVDLTMNAGAAVGSLQTARFQMRSPEGDLFGTHPFALVFAAPGSGICPVPGTDQATFINIADRFCFLYPDGHDAYVGALGDTFVNAPPSGGSTEEILSSVNISPEGSTGGLNLNQWTNQMVDDWKAPGTTPTVSNVQVNGIAARYTDDLPGQVGNRIVFMVYDGDGYVLTVLPVDGSFPAKTTAALDIWDLVRSEFTFFGP